MRTYSIAEASERTKIKPHTIRVWERRHQLLQPIRTKTLIRVYQKSDICKLLVVAALKKRGYKISAIVAMLPMQRVNKLKSLIYQQHNTSRNVRDLINLIIRLDDQGVKKFFDDYDMDKKRIKIIWEASRIIHEYRQLEIITDLQYKYALSAFRNLLSSDYFKNMENRKMQPEYNVTPLPILFFTPEETLFDIPLMCLNIESYHPNHLLVYLGTGVQIDEITMRSPTWVISLTNEYTEEELTDQINNIDKARLDHTVLLYCPALDQHQIKLPENFDVITDLIFIKPQINKHVY